MFSMTILESKEIVFWSSDTGANVLAPHVHMSLIVKYKYSF
jgi:hypothetical protein